MKNPLAELGQDVTNIKQVARVQALYEAIRNTQAVGVRLVKIHQFMVDHDLYSGSYASFRGELSRISRRLSKTSSQPTTMERRPKTLQSPSVTTAPDTQKQEAIPDIYKPGMTDKQRREALADYFCDPSQNLHPLLKKILEKKK